MSDSDSPIEDVHIEDVDEIEAAVEPFDWPFARTRAADIAAHWRGLVTERPRLFDGRVLLQSHAAITMEHGRRILRGVHFETNFSAFISWRDFGFPDSSVRNCFAMAALRGDDDGFVLGEMATDTANAGRVYFPAGTPDPSDVVGDRLDLHGSVLRELAEETGLSADEVNLDPGWSLADAGPMLACMKLARVAAPAAEVAREIETRIARQVHPELARMHVVRSPDDIPISRAPRFIVAWLTHMLTRD